MLPRKAKRHLFRTQSLVGLGIDFQYPLPKLHILQLPVGRPMPQVLVVGTAVDSNHPAKDGYGMLRGQGVDDVSSLLRF